ncbi:MBL fold metallo-hydrolase [Oceaniserpentilla sp. 4NH20-0058]|uniref:MBL fold metallo-hydrolase n=1 Tax=Oceaniserpentilla sp. 4NH20-0058 TaxID=3127660 RepID=UPI003342BB02
MKIESFYHQDTQTFCHLLYDEVSQKAAIIDPVLDYKANSGKIGHEFSDTVIERVKTLNLTLHYILETHVHADHLSAAQYIKQLIGGQVYIGSQVSKVQQHFDDVFNLNSLQESLFDHLIEPNNSLMLGDIVITAISTPGHTPACMSYVVTRPNDVTHVFVGDTLFMPDIGTARCDFPGGDAHSLYQSVQTLYALGDETLLHMCHDYPPEQRGVRSVVTVKEQRESNIHCADGITEAQFIKIRQGRDLGLDAPRLILPSLQVNIRAGFLPEADEKGRRFLKIPLR